MPERNLALRRRIAPSTLLKLILTEPEGNIEIDLKLAFNMNAGAAVQEKTLAPHRPDGLLLTDVGIWNHIGEPKVLRAMLWAAALAHQPEYDTGDDEGLLTIGSYIQESNSDEIVEAIWKAYLTFLPPAKRELLLTIKAEAEARAKRGETNRPLVGTEPPENETIPLTGSSSGPSADTTSISASTSSAS